MATAKKSTTKKATSRATAVKKTTKSTKARKPRILKADRQSFRIVKEDVPFTSFRITRQTVYWVILVAFIVFAQLWIINLQVQVASLLDAQQTQLQQL